MSTATEAAAAPPEKKSKKKLLIAVIGVVALLGVGYLVVLPKISKPVSAATKKGAASTPTASAKPGAVLKEESITLNLAGGHYLRLGLALQLPAGVAETDVDGSRALNLAIESLSGSSVASLSGPHRSVVISKLDKAIVAGYGSATVSGVYLTDFVMQ